MSTNKRLRIAIVGAGIAGLTLFQGLRSMDKGNKLDVKIYESAEQLMAIGAGIVLSPRALQIMRTIGLGDQIAAILPEGDPNALSPIFVVRKGDQPEGFYVHEAKTRGVKGRLLRSELQDVLMSNLTNELHLGHQLLSYDELDDEITLHFTNGHNASCDFLVGADGIRSAVRRSFLEKQGLSHSTSMHPVWTGAYIYRGLISRCQLEAEYPGHRACATGVLYLGKYKNLVAYPLSRAGPVNIVVIKCDHSKEGAVHEGPIATTCSQDEVLSLFQGWEPEALVLVKCLKQPVKWAVDILPPLGHFAKGNVALVGDSAHAMTPYQGAGGGQAIEDSYILASLLSSHDCTRELIPKVAEIYDAIRRGPANEAAEISRIAGILHLLMGPGFEHVVEGDTSVTVDELKVIFETTEKMWAPLRKESLEDCKDRALAMLKDQCAKD